MGSVARGTVREEKGAVGTGKCVPCPDVRASAFQGRPTKKESNIFMQSLQVLNIGLIFFNILWRLNEMCPILPECLVCYYYPVAALNPFNILHILDKDLMVNSIYFSS